MKKRILAVAMALTMALTCVPAVTYADDMQPNDENQQPTVTQEQTGESESETTEPTEENSTENTEENAISETPEDELQTQDENADSLLEPVTTLQARTGEGGIILSWSATDDTPAGYAVYKKIDGSWQMIKKTAYTAYTDAGNYANGTNEYVVAPYYDEETSCILDEEGAESSKTEVIWIDRPETVNGQMQGSSMQVSWTANQIVSGYQVEYGTSPLFNNAKMCTVVGADSVSTTIEGLTSGKTYYFRVRGYIGDGDNTSYSLWTTSTGTGFNLTTTYTDITKSNFYTIVGESTGSSAYDVIQGGCSHGEYLYYLLHNTKNQLSKIVKIRISDCKLMQKSAAFDADHGNSITYNARSNTIVIANSRVNFSRLTVVDAATLKVTKQTDVVFPTDTYITNSESTSITGTYGFSSITYCEDDDCYIAITKSSKNIMVVLDGDFNVISAIYMSKAHDSEYWYQDMLATKDYLLVCESSNRDSESTYSSCRDILAVYDYFGNYLGEIQTRTRYELENINYYNGAFYAAYHTSHYKYYYTKWKYWKRVKKTKKNYKKYNTTYYKTKKSGKRYKVYRRKFKSKTFERIGFISRLGL